MRRGGARTRPDSPQFQVAQRDCRATGCKGRNRISHRIHSQSRSYDGTGGVKFRDDLAGLNLSRVPKVFIECANMRNAADAALLTSPRWQAGAARAIATGLTAFLTRG